MTSAVTCRTNAREELRLQIGTLRFDLDTLAAQLPKETRKKAKALNQTFFKKVCPKTYCLHTMNPSRRCQYRIWPG